MAVRFDHHALETSAMIAGFTQGPGRAKLRFAEAVRREFEFLERIFGFRCTEESPTFVRYESDYVFVNVFHGRGSFEIGIELGIRSQPTIHFRLPEILAGLAPGYTGERMFQASTAPAVAKCVARLARIVDDHCSAALAGDRFALRAVENAAGVESERVTLQYQYGAIIDRADHAWEAGEREKAALLYASAERALDETRRRRLSYMRAKSR